MSAEFGMQSGGSYQQAVGGVSNMAGAIFGQIAANKSITDLNINYDDAVIESTSVDSQQLVIAIASVTLFGYSLYLAFK
tara:strand:- start:14378 stop:14614 length:237 start_codon:yes stop_codon:yes gene_type:complete